MNRAARGTTAGGARYGRTAAVVVSLCALAVVFALGAGSVAGSVPPGSFAHNDSSTPPSVNTTDTEPPEIADTYAINASTIAFVFTDNHDVEEASIDAGDFSIARNNVSVTNVTVTESGVNATAEIGIESDAPLLLNTLQVGYGNATITDTNNNSLDTSGTAVATVRGVDGVPPGVTEFSVTNATGGPAEILIRGTEPLHGINVTIDGPEEEVLRRDDFRKERNNAYSARYHPEKSGTYVLVLRNVTDRAGNKQFTYTPRQIYADVSGPDAVAGIDVAASSGLTFAFEAGQSSDPSGIANYTWLFDDGTTASGSQVTHTFTPGNHTVRLRVTDVYGNVGNDTLTLNLSPNETVTRTNLSAAAANATTVSIDRSGETATVTIRRARVGRPVTAAGFEPIVSRDPIALEAMTITVTRNRSLTLAVAAETPDAVTTVATGDRRPLGGFTVIHTVPDDAFDNVTFRVNVSTAALSELRATRESVAVYRRHDGQWNELPTTMPKDTTAFRIRSPGLSRFAVTATTDTAATPTPTPTDTPAENDTATPASNATATATPAPTATTTPAPSGGDAAGFNVTSAALNRTSAPANGTVAVNVTVANRGDSTGQFTAGLSVNESVVRTKAVAVPPNGTREFQFVFRVNETGGGPVSVNGTAAGRLSVGGGLLGFLPLGLLGVLPIGLAGTLLRFVAAPVVAVYLGLKGVALYLGY